MPQEHKARFCAYCARPMVRKRWSNGELQSWQHYNRQKYCDRDCMRKAMLAKPKTGTSWMTVHYHARQLLPTGCCEICGRSQNVDVHHKDNNPQNNEISNLQRLCRSCHLKAHRGARKCSICGKKVKGLGYCDKHYQRYKKYGNPFAVKKNGVVILLDD